MVLESLASIKLPRVDVDKKTDGIPYLNQFGTRDQVGDILDQKVRPSTLFPSWSSFGAAKASEFDELTREICGMTCLYMILKYKDKPCAGPIKLFYDSFEYGCYKNNEQGEILGLFHHPFVNFIGKEFSLLGSAVQYIGPSYVAKQFLDGKHVIASVNPEIREENPKVDRPGGHLVLITGLRKNKQGIEGFYIHNPSGTNRKRQEYHFVSLNNFLKCFSGNVIVVN